MKVKGGNRVKCDGIGALYLKKQKDEGSLVNDPPLREKNTQL